MIHRATNDSIQWGFDNLCINQTHVITNEPTPSPTDPPTMSISECNYYKTRLSDWDLLYNVSLTEFYPAGIEYVKFSPINTYNYESDWLFSVDTNLYFPTISTDPIWLNIEMNGFSSMSRYNPDLIDIIRPIMFSQYIFLTNTQQFSIVFHSIQSAFRRREILSGEIQLRIKIKLSLFLHHNFQPLPIFSHAGIEILSCMRRIISD